MMGFRAVLFGMLHPRRIGSLGAAAVTALLVTWVWTGAARADFSWSEAFQLNGGTAVACPTATQCTAVGQNGAKSGDEVTFNPQSPSSRSEVTIDSGGNVFDIDCPSATQCTALDSQDQEVTFNPQAPGSPTPVTIDNAPTGSGSGLEMVSCPSTTQCTATDSVYQEMTFNPQAPGSPTPVVIDSGPAANGLDSIDCPSTSQCTATDDHDQLLTFNPASPGGVATTNLGKNGHQLLSVACVSTSQCTAVGEDNNGADFELTFNPAAIGQPPLVFIGGMNMGPGPDEVACPSSTQCTIEDQVHEATFNPQAPGSPTGTTFDNSNGDSGGHWIACPLTTECVTTDVDGRVDVGVPGHGGGGGGGGSAPKPKCVVPKVKGKTLAAAKRAIVKAHCTVGKVSKARSKHVKRGRVISQSPSAGKSLRSGSKVNFVVSKGK